MSKMSKTMHHYRNAPITNKMQIKVQDKTRKNKPELSVSEVSNQSTECIYSILFAAA